MKKILNLTSSLLFCLYACNNADKQAKSENDVDAARNFLQAALQGDYEKAKKYMILDSVNIGWMNAFERMTLSDIEKKGLANASINIHEVSNKIKDSVTVVIYSNSFKNNRDTLKVIKQNGQWLVDFKYLFNHDDSDTLPPPPLPVKDSISK